MVLLNCQIARLLVNQIQAQNFCGQEQKNLSSIVVKDDELALNNVWMGGQWKCIEINHYKLV